MTNRAVLISIQPYYVFLIIVHTMGWDVPQEKTIEIRKDFPQSEDWDKQTVIYCSKNRQSFNRIPKEYQPLMVPLLGKVVGEFVCDRIDKYRNYGFALRDENYEVFDVVRFLSNACLSANELVDYIRGRGVFYGWHISELKIYDKPKDVSDFFRACIRDENAPCGGCPRYIEYFDRETLGWAGAECYRDIRRPPQSWMYIEEV